MLDPVSKQKQNPPLRDGRIHTISYTFVWGKLLRELLMEKVSCFFEQWFVGPLKILPELSCDPIIPLLSIFSRV